jgi:hypothetical protein
VFPSPLQSLGSIPLEIGVREVFSQTVPSVYLGVVDETVDGLPTRAMLGQTGGFRCDEI